MIHPVNILVAPLALVLWAIDIYVFLAGIRLIAGRLSGPKAAEVCSWLRQATDSLPHGVEVWMAAHTARPVPRWLPWVVVIVAAILVRNLIGLMIILCMGGPTH
jgi:hypothetical protein